MQPTKPSALVAKVPSPMRALATFSVLLAFGCQSIFDSEDADAKWRTDYARCRFGMTPEQLEALNENPEAEAPRQNPAWKPCLIESGWDMEPGSQIGPEWQD